MTWGRLDSNWYLGKGQQSQGLREFFVMPGESRHFVILDSAPFLFKAHHILVGKRVRRLTCPGDDCPACDAGDYASQAASLTVYDITNTSVKSEKKLYVLRKKSIDVFRMTCEGVAKQTSQAGQSNQEFKLDDLSGSSFIVNRMSRQDPSSGITFVYSGKWDLKMFPDVQVADYFTLLKPSVDKIKEALNQRTPSTEPTH